MALIASSFHLPAFSSAPLRSAKQLLAARCGWRGGLWDALQAGTFKPRGEAPAVVERLKARAALPGFFVSSCECGACRAVAASAPGHVMVCHCSACRAGRANERPPHFVSVRRSRALLLTQGPGAEIVQSSYMASRASCRACGTLLAMDYERLDPNTIWLVGPMWYRRPAVPGEERLEAAEGLVNPGARLGAPAAHPLRGARGGWEGAPDEAAAALKPWAEEEALEAYHPEHVFNGGKADVDVLWSSRAEGLAVVRPEAHVPRAAARSEEGRTSWEHFARDSARFAEAAAAAEAVHVLREEGRASWEHFAPGAARLA